MDNATVSESDPGIDELTIQLQLYTPNLATHVLRTAPRMGNTDEFALLASSKPSDKFEYTSGLIFLGSFYIVFFFMWSLVILMFKWLGPEHVGFWSGHAMEPVDRGTPPKQFIRRYKIKLVRAIFAISALLWIAFVIVFLSAGIQGLEQAKSAYNQSSMDIDQLLNSIDMNFADLQFECDATMVLRDSVLKDLINFCSSSGTVTSKKQSASTVRRKAAETVAPAIPIDETTASQVDSIFASLGNFTTTSDAQTPAPSPGFNTPTSNPFGSGNRVRTDVPALNLNISAQANPVTTSTDLNFTFGSNATLNLTDFGDSTGLFDSASDEFAHAIGFFNFAGDDVLRVMVLDMLYRLMLLDDFIGTERDQGQNGINATKQIAKMLSDTASKANPHSTLAIVFSIFWLLVAKVLLVAVVMAWRKRPLTSMLPRISRYVIPLLGLFTAASTILAVLSVTYAIANADFCSGGQRETPEDTILQMMITKGISRDDFVFMATKFYVTQCQSEYPFDVLDDFQDDLDSASLSLSEMESTFASQSMESIVAQCGTDAEGIDSLVSTLNSHILNVQEVLQAVQSNLTCDDVVPIFTSTAYDAACNVSVNGLYYCYVSFIVMAFTGMIMLTLRTAYLPVDGEEDELRAAAAKALDKDIELGTAYNSDDDDEDYSESGSDSEESSLEKDSDESSDESSDEKASDDDSDDSSDKDSEDDSDEKDSDDDSDESSDKKDSDDDSDESADKKDSDGDSDESSDKKDSDDDSDEIKKDSDDDSDESSDKKDSDDASDDSSDKKDSDDDSDESSDEKDDSNEDSDKTSDDTEDDDSDEKVNSDSDKSSDEEEDSDSAESEDSNSSDSDSS